MFNICGGERVLDMGGGSRWGFGFKGWVYWRWISVGLVIWVLGCGR